MLANMRHFGVFAMVGGGVMLIGAALLFLLVHVLHIDTNIAYALQTFVSIELNFRLNNKTTWRDRPGRTWDKWKRFYCSKIGTIALNQVLFALCVYIGMNYLVAYAACAVLVMVVNYVWNDTFVFAAGALVQEELQ